MLKLNNISSADFKHLEAIYIGRIAFGVFIIAETARTAHRLHPPVLVHTARQLHISAHAYSTRHLLCIFPGRAHPS